MFYVHLLYLLFIGDIMRKLIINENDANQRLDKFLLKTLNDLPKSLMYKYIRNKKIKVNGKRCEISTRLQVNDEVTCYISEEFFQDKKDDSFFNAKSELDILYEDENIIIMNKEVGLLVHSDDSKEIDTLVNRMKKYLYDKKEYDYHNEQSFAPALCHRIDRNTQGIVIGAKNAEALREVNRLIHDGNIEKSYLCIVEGKFTKKEDIVYAYHTKIDKQIYISNEFKTGYKKIKTGYKVQKEKENLSLLEVRLYSGKSHQIRALMAHLHHPLYGDTRYGAKKRSYPYQALCAYKVKFLCEEGPLSYLHQKTFEIKKVDFLKYVK